MTPREIDTLKRLHTAGLINIHKDHVTGLFDEIERLRGQLDEYQRMANHWKTERNKSLSELAIYKRALDYACGCTQEIDPQECLDDARAELKPKEKLVHLNAPRFCVLCASGEHIKA